MNSVVSGSSGFSVSAMWAPSTLETKCRRGPSWIGRERQRRHGRAEVGAADADVDDVGEGLAGRALARAVAKARGEGAHRLRERPRRRRRRACPSTAKPSLSWPRRATWRTARFSVALIGAPANIASRLSSRPRCAAKAKSAARSSAPSAHLRHVEQEIVEPTGEGLERSGSAANRCAMPAARAALPAFASAAIRSPFKSATWSVKASVRAGARSRLHHRGQTLSRPASLVKASDDKNWWQDDFCLGNEQSARRLSDRARSITARYPRISSERRFRERNRESQLISPIPDAETRSITHFAGSGEHSGSPTSKGSSR